MFEEGQLYSPVSDRRRRRGHRPPGRRPPRRGRPRLPRAAATRSPPPRSPGAPGEPAAARSTTRDDEHEVWRTVCRELAPKHERFAVREYREARRRASALPHDRVPQPRRGDARASRRSAAGATCPPPASSPLREFYGSLARAHVPLDPVRAPPGACRSTRPSRTSSTRSSATATCSPRRRSASCTASPASPTQPPARRRQRCASCRACSGSRSSSASSSRTASCAPTAPGSCRATARSSEFRAHGAPPARPRRDGHGRLRHHALPAGAVPRRVGRRGRGRRRRLLRHLHRRLDRGAAPRAKAVA